MKTITLEGKVALVTGASRGLGRAIAEEFARAGADLVVNYNSTPCNDLVQFAESLGRRAVAVQADVSKTADCERLVEEAVKTFGKLDILVANAGILKAGDITEMDPADWRRVLEVNLTGYFLSAQAAARVMKEQRSGKIVTVASYAGMVAGMGGGYAHYGANKAAIAHYTRYLAQELGPYNINANCIAPGVIETARIVQLVGARPGSNEQVNPEIALRRNGQPEDCAKVVEFLCTDLSDYVTGAVIPIDGGWNRAA